MRMGLMERIRAHAREPEGSRRAARARLAGAAALVLLLGAGCGTGGPGGQEEAAVEDGAAPGEGGAPQAEEPAAGAEAPDLASATGTADAEPSERFVVHTARVVIEAEDIDAAVAAAKAGTLEAGGHIEEEQVRGAADEAPHAELTLRVPTESYEESLAELADLGERLELEQQAEDVTAEVADVESRVESAESALDRLRDFLDEADSMSEMLEVEAEIGDRQAELEALQARQRALAAQTSLSTIRLVVTSPDTYVTEQEREEGPLGFTGALAQGWSAVASLMRGIAVLTGWLLPFLPLAALVVLPVWLLRRHRSSAAAPSSTEDIPTESEPAGEPPKPSAE